ncbi:MAG: MarR family winged helix-turn-helix transcriptional regulator [Blautia massiliensis (ex Durand et al. 2017)]
MEEKDLMEKYDKLNRKMHRYFSSYFVGTPLTSIQALVLHYIIMESKTRDVFPKDLEVFLEIKPSSVTSLINNLERNGYLRRESLADDARYKRLVLTDKTLAIQDEILRRIHDYMESMFTGISDEDLKVFEKVILQMTENIQ